VLLSAGCASEATTSPDAVAVAANKGGSGGGSATGTARSGSTQAPTFLSPASGAPSAAGVSVSFYAVQGEDRQATLYYHPLPGAQDSARLLQFRVRPRARMTLPNGARVAEGDSVLITMTVADPVKLIVDFQPSGLRFGTNDPTKLTIRYGEQSRDLNGDGIIDSADARIERSLSIFGQETSTSPWFQVKSLVSTELYEVEAAIFGFTNYVIAY
jgi:hypothetical protein